MPDLQTQLSKLPSGTSAPVSQPVATPKPSGTGIFAQPVDKQALALARSIAIKESGNNYNAKGDNDTAAGSGQWSNQNAQGVAQPLAPGQIPNNFKTEASQYGLDPNDFSPENQDKVLYAEVYTNKQKGLSPAQIAAAHNAGMKRALDGSWQQNVGTTTLNGKQIAFDTPKYVEQVADLYKKQLAQLGNPTEPTTQSPSTSTSKPTTPDTLAPSNPGHPAVIPAHGSTPSLSALKQNLANLPGQAAQATNAVLPILGDVGGDINGSNSKTALEQGGDAVQSALSAALLIPGAQPEDLAAKAGLEGVTARIGANAATGGLIGASNAVGQGKSGGQVAEQGLLGAGLGGIGGASSGLIKALTPAQKLQSFIDDATPSYSSKIIGEQPVKEGLLSRSVVPTSQNIEAGTELSKVPNYPTTGTNLEKYQAIEPVIAQKGQALDASLKAENVLRPPKELSKIIKDALTTTGDNSYLLQKSDPLIKNYQRVADNAIKNNEGTLYGERQVVKTLDNAYESAGGKYGNNKALDQLHRAARTALINDMESKATNTGVKASLKEMSNLYNAQDILLDKAKSEGGTAIQRLAKNNPLASKAVGLLGRYTGLDAALHLLP